jgi:hypothetical protein
MRTLLRILLFVCLSLLASLAIYVATLHYATEKFNLLKVGMNEHQVESILVFSTKKRVLIGETYWAKNFCFASDRPKYVVVYSVFCLHPIEVDYLNGEAKHIFPAFE